MERRWTRRGFLRLAGAASVLAAGAAAGCAGKPADDADTGDDSAGGPVTITHLFGQTTVPEPPKRVVCAGYTGQDDLLALGVVPVAVTNWFGDQPYGVWPWAAGRLGDAKPTLLSLDNGIAVDKIAALKPDLIVATNAGVDAETYRRLAEIAPTLPQTDGQAFFEPWKVQAGAIGRAVHQRRAMQTLIEQVDAGFAAVATANPRLKGRRVALLGGRTERGAVAVHGGWRTDFLAAMGLSVAQLPAVLPADRIRADLDGLDALIFTTDGDEQRDALLADPAIAALQRRAVFTDAELGAAIAFASPLSYPVVTERLPGLLAKAVAG